MHYSVIVNKLVYRFWVWRPIVGPVLVARHRTSSDVSNVSLQVQMTTMQFFERSELGSNGLIQNKGNLVDLRNLPFRKGLFYGKQTFMMMRSSDDLD